MYKYITDKYFRDLDAYNKVLVPHKLTFFKTAQGLSSFEFLKKLSFNLDYNSSNYRWGQRYFDNFTKDFVWITSNNNKCVPQPFFNQETHQYDVYDAKAYFTEEQLHNHFFAHDKTNRKISFYYKLNQLDKDELSNYDTALKNMYKVHKNTYGSTQQLNSNILLIDIDNYEYRSAIETLSLFLDTVNLNICDLLYLEQNAYTGGIHTALVLPYQITNTEFYSQLMKKLNEEGIRIECNFINSILRFPLSFEYVAIKHNEKVLYFDEFIPQQYWEESFDSYMNNMNWNPVNSEYLNNLYKELHNISDYKNYWNIKKHIIKRKKNIKIKNRHTFYNIRSGQRYDTMSKMVPYCKLMGMSLDETSELIYNQNIDSKDLSKWSLDKLKHNITNFYNKCDSQVFSLTRNNKFISNEIYLPIETLTFLESEQFKEQITNRFVYHYINERRKHDDNFKSLSLEKVKVLKEVLPTIFKEIIGKMYFDVNNEKQFIDGINEELGFQISDSYLKKLQDYSIESNGIDSPLSKTSLQYLKKSIIKTLSLSEIKYKNRKRNWMLGSCKSYTVKSIYDIYMLLDHLYNSINNKKIWIEEFNLDNNIHILYILLNGNPRVEIRNDKIPINEKIT